MPVHPDTSKFDTAALIAGASFVTYLVFKRYEPDSPLPLFLLLGVVPGFVTNQLLPVLSSNLIVASLTVYIPFYALILLYIAVYRISPFHPLAKYPGPTLGKLSKFRTSWILAKGKVYLHYKDLHEKHGDIVRVGPNEVSFRNIESILPILNTLPKGPFWDGHEPGKKGSPTSLLATRELAEHARRRRTWNRAFNTAAIKNYEVFIIRIVRLTLTAFEDRAGKPIDLGLWMNYYGFDAMGELSFGHNFDLIQTGKATDEIQGIMDHSVKLSTISAQTPWAYRAFTFWAPGVSRATNRLRQFGIRNVQRRIKLGGVTRDLFHYLADEEGLEPAKISMPVIVSDGVLSIIAGSDTTAGTLTIMWYFLLRNPDICKRLVEEIDTTFPNGQDTMIMLTLAHMPFLNACINETLRLWPPAMSGSQKSVLPNTTGAMIGSEYVPKGTQIFVHTYSVHRDPRNFSYPDTFWPDRWLPEKDRQYPSGIDKALTGVHRAGAYIPFSLGPAACPAKNLVLMSMRALMSSILQKFTVQLAEGTTLEGWEDHLKDYFTIGRAPIHVVMTPREH